MTDSIPIFDSLTHPTFDGNWIMPRYKGTADIETLLSEMEQNNVHKAFAVGMQTIGNYSEDRFIKMIKTEGNSKLLPIAYLSFDNKNQIDIRQELMTIKKKGYVGVKIHPRISNLLLDNPLIPYAIDMANEQNLSVLFCSYLYSDKQSYLINNIYQIGEILLKIDSNSKIVLLHGGGVRLLEMMEIVRAFPNTLLDLSFTLSKYTGSSLDMDIQFLFKNFDQRICIGSDFPEITISKLRTRFDSFSRNIDTTKAENIAYKNLSKFIGI